MEIRQIRRQLNLLERSQRLNMALICAGLISLPPDDAILLRLYEVQDELYLEIRRLILELPGLDHTLLDEFDRRLNEHRVNVMLVSQNIRPQV